MEIPLVKILDVKEYVNQLQEGIYAIDNFQPSSQLALMQFLHIQNKPVILGIDLDTSYQRRYKCEPPICFDEKINIWRNILPPNSIMFPIPEFTLSDDVLAQRVGVYRNPKVIHVGLYEGDKKELRSIMRRACRNNYMTFIPILES